MGRGTELYRKQVAETHTLVDEMSKEAEALKEMVEEAKGAHASALDAADNISADAPASHSKDETDNTENIVDPFAKFKS